MPRINLLPWREERLKEQQKAFGMAALFVVIIAGFAVYVVMQAVNGMIQHQQARNAYLQNEIKALDARIAEIRELEQQKASLLARMNIIEQLQSSRPEIVHLFDELVTTIPDGVHLTSLSQSGQNLELQGVAYRRQLDALGELPVVDACEIECRGHCRGACPEGALASKGTRRHC